MAASAAETRTTETRDRGRTEANFCGLGSSSASPPSCRSTDPRHPEDGAIDMPVADGPAVEMMRWRILVVTTTTAPAVVENLSRRLLVEIITGHRNNGNNGGGADRGHHQG